MKNLLNVLFSIICLQVYGQEVIVDNENQFCLFDQVTGHCEDLLDLRKSKQATLEDYFIHDSTKIAILVGKRERFFNTIDYYLFYHCYKNINGEWDWDVISLSNEQLSANSNYDTDSIDVKINALDMLSTYKNHELEKTLDINKLPHTSLKAKMKDK